jgi:integrase
MRWHINDDAFRKRFTAAVRASGVRRRITPHDMRRAGATHFYRRTKDLERLQVILGHNDPTTTMDYIFKDEIAISGHDSPIEAILAA